MVHFGVCTGEFWAIQFKEKTGFRQFNGTHSCVIWSRIYSIYFGGCIFGAMVMAISLEFLGSKNTLTLATSLSIFKWVSAVLFDSTTSTGILMFYFGFGCNILISSSIYIGEISPAEKRGTFIVFMASGMPVGLLIYVIFKAVFDTKTAAVIHTCICSLSALLFLKLENTPYYFIAIEELKNTEN